jgi:hypothetical protein
MTPAQLEELHFLAAPVQPTSVIDLRPHRASRQPDGERKWPDYQRALAGAPLKDDGSGPDRSDADFFWCKIAAQRHWTVEEITQKLLEGSEKARGGDKGYARVTAQNAATAAQDGRRRGRG